MKRKFSQRELQIIKLICRAETSKEIGGILKLSKRTVEGYRLRIMKKMNVVSMIGIVIYAFRNKIVTIEEF